MCPTMITANLDPVCGSDGQTYPNPSALESMSCLANRIVEEEYRGKCKGVYRCQNQLRIRVSKTPTAFNSKQRYEKLAVAGRVL